MRQDQYPYLSVDEMAEAEPILATVPVPEHIQQTARADSGLFVQAGSKPTLDFATEQLPGAPGIWRVLDSLQGEELRTTVPGQRQTELDPGEIADLDGDDVGGTDGYLPPWVDQDFLPKLVPFTSAEVPGHTFLEPRAHRRATGIEAEEAQRLTYPWRTVGKVFSRGDGFGMGGSGVLVGPNLLLTASHVAPWGVGNWSMEFIPGFRAGTAPPFGNSFVREFRGYRIGTSPTGYDYVVCRLFNPLGNSLSWMGTQSWGNDDEYYRRRFTSSGYPDSFGGRPAVEFNIGVVDIDNDDPGKEIELPIGHPLTAGWSGGPLWFFAGQSPIVVGVQSGAEKDGFDPRRNVTAGGNGMVELVKFGLANWRP